MKVLVLLLFPSSSISFSYGTEVMVSRSPWQRMNSYQACTHGTNGISCGADSRIDGRCFGRQSSGRRSGYSPSWTATGCPSWSPAFPTAPSRPLTESPTFAFGSIVITMARVFRKRIFCFLFLFVLRFRLLQRFARGGAICSDSSAVGGCRL